MTNKPQMPMDPNSVEAAYRHCQSLAQSHYENFPVASWILPRPMRRPVAVVYAFARTADDLADEGADDIETRLQALDDYQGRLGQTAAGQPPADPVFIAVADVLKHKPLPVSLFFDLLSAFRQDVTRKRYRDFADLLDYCRRSANPVGRLLLHLHGSASAENLVLSDRICTSLQLINFYQDLAQDFDENGRIYIPVDEMEALEVSEMHFEQRRSDPAMRRLFSAQVARGRAMMLEGAPLGSRLRGRFGLEIRMIVEGGLAVLERLAAAEDVFARPRLRRRDLLRMLFRSLRPWRPSPPSALPDHAGD